MERRSSTAVSYTHLDVYKRQEWMGGNTAVALFWVMAVIAFSFLVVWGINAYTARHQGYRDGAHVGAVSYTHLDVYKRQGRGSSRRARLAGASGALGRPFGSVAWGRSAMLEGGARNG